MNLFICYLFIIYLLRYLCLFVYSGVLFVLFLRPVSCVPNVASLFLLPPSVFSNVNLIQAKCCLLSVLIYINIIFISI